MEQSSLRMQKSMLKMKLEFFFLQRMLLLEGRICFPTLKEFLSTIKGKNVLKMEQSSLRMQKSMLKIKLEFFFLQRMVTLRRKNLLSHSKRISLHN